MCVTRIASNIVTGIGFLGAGTILRDGGRIGGLTTAATIWLAAALGMGIEANQTEIVLAATDVALVVLLLFLGRFNYFFIAYDWHTQESREVRATDDHG